MKRPKSVTLLALGVLSLTGIYLVRFVQTILQWELLTALPLGVPPVYLGLTGALWSALGLGLVWGLWKGRPWAPKAVLIAALAFAGYRMVDRVFLVSSSTGATNWPFLLGLTVFLLTLMYWILSRPKARAFFGDLND